MLIYVLGAVQEGQFNITPDMVAIRGITPGMCMSTWNQSYYILPQLGKAN
jgi:hypothetical protein